MLSWALDLAPIFGPAGLVFAVYILAKRNVWDTKRRPCTDDARPYDPRRIDWRR